jgi:hypothetical protein
MFCLCISFLLLSYPVLHKHMGFLVSKVLFCFFHVDLRVISLCYAAQFTSYNKKYLSFLA